MSETRQKLITWAESLADPNFCLSVSTQAKQVIRDLLTEIESRTITTAEELEALHMVVVRSDTGTIANIVNGKGYCFGYENSFPASDLAMPITVLWEPAL